MKKNAKTATIHFTEDGADGLREVLEGLIGRNFHYKDQDGNHFVQLQGVEGGTGCVTLQDVYKSSLRPYGHPYSVSLYDDGVLTYV